MTTAEQPKVNKEEFLKLGFWEATNFCQEQMKRNLWDQKTAFAALKAWGTEKKAKQGVEEYVQELFELE